MKSYQEVWNMNKGKKSSVSFRLDDNREKCFTELCEKHGIGKTELFLGMIDAGYYLNKKDVTANCVELMDTVQTLHGACDETLYQNLRKAVEKVCQSLLIK